MTSVSPVAPNFAPFFYDTKASVNIESGFKGRMARPIPRNSHRELRKAAVVAEDFAATLFFRGYRRGSLWFMDSKSYTSAQKRLMLEERDHLIGYTNEPARVNAFGKVENYPHEGKVMRIIYARELRFKLFFAPHVKVVEEAVFHAEPVWRTHFVKGQNRDQIQNNMVRRVDIYPHVYVLDHTAFESTVSSVVMQYLILPIYRRAQVPEWMLAVIVGWQHIHNQAGRMRVRGGTMSGEMDTSLRNGLVNHILMLYVTRGTDADWLIEGDDVIIGSGQPLDFSPLTRMGFSLKIDAVAHSGRSGFCGWYFDRETLTALKPPSKILNLFYVGKNLLGYPRAYLDARYAGKMMSLSHQYPSSPLVWNLPRHVSTPKAFHDGGWWSATKLETDNVEFEAVGDVLISAYRPREVRPPSRSARNAYFELFGVHPEDQIRIENELAFQSPTLDAWVRAHMPAQAKARIMQEVRRARK
jgi:hypothetical protein